jgi:hypothetical protein
MAPARLLLLAAAIVAAPAAAGAHAPPTTSARAPAGNAAPAGDAAPAGNVTIQTFKSRACVRYLGARNASFTFGACRPLGRHFVTVDRCSTGDAVLNATFHASADCSDRGVPWAVPTDGSCFDTGEEGINLPVGCNLPPPTPTPPAVAVRLAVYANSFGCTGTQFTPVFNVTRDCSLVALGPTLNFAFARFVSCTSSPSGAGGAGSAQLLVWPYAARGCGNESAATLLTAPTGCSYWNASSAYVNASCILGQPGNATSASATPSSSALPSPPPASAAGTLAVYYSTLNSTVAPPCGGVPTGGVYNLSEAACTPVWMGGGGSAVYYVRLLSCYTAVRFNSADDCYAGNGTGSGVVVPLSPGTCVSSLLGSYFFACTPGGGNGTAVAPPERLESGQRDGVGNVLPTAAMAQLAAVALVGSAVGGALVAVAVALVLRRRHATRVTSGGHTQEAAPAAASTPLLLAARWDE